MLSVWDKRLQELQAVYCCLYNDWSHKIILFTFPSLEETLKVSPYVSHPASKRKWLALTLLWKERDYLLFPMSIMTMLELECWRASSNHVARWSKVSRLEAKKNNIKHMLQPETACVCTQGHHMVAELVHCICAQSSVLHFIVCNQVEVRMMSYTTTCITQQKHLTA